MPFCLLSSHVRCEGLWLCLECGLEVKVSEQPQPDLCWSKSKRGLARLNLCWCAEIALFVLCRVDSMRIQHFQAGKAAYPVLAFSNGRFGGGEEGWKIRQAKPREAKLVDGKEKRKREEHRHSPQRRRRTAE